MKIVASFILITCFACSSQNVPIQVEERIPARVNVFSVEESEQIPMISSFGSMTYRTKADVSTVVEGLISEINVEEGDFVTKGAILAVLKNLQIQIRYDQAVAALGSAQTAYSLAKAKLDDSCMQIEGKLLSLDKLHLQYNQKEKEIQILKSKLADKQELHKLGGLSSKEITGMEFSIEAAINDLQILKSEIEIQSIGFRNSDIVRSGYSVPTDEKIRLELLKKINTKSLIAEAEVLKSKVESAGTEVKSAELLLSQLHIKSPIEGIVGAQYLQSGERAETNTRMFTIFDSSQVDVVFPVPETKGILIQKGMSVKLFIDAVHKTEPIHAEVRQIAPTIDPQSGTLTIKAGLANSNNLFRPGMFARIKLPYASPKTVVLIPKSSLLSEQQNTAEVFQIKNNRLQKRQITTGSEYGDSIEVKSGLTKGMHIVDSPSPLLKEGETVEIIKN